MVQEFDYLRHDRLGEPGIWSLTGDNVGFTKDKTPEPLCLLSIVGDLKQCRLEGRQQAPQQQRPYLNEAVTDEEVRRWRHIGTPFSELANLREENIDLRRVRAQLETIKREINQHGRDPMSTVVDAMRNNRVLIWGEHHTSPNPNRDLGAQAMVRLREAGATHLALEWPVSMQPQLDEFMRTGRIDRSTMPRLLRTDDYMAMLTAARDAGLRLVAVDMNYVRTREEQEQRATRRDQHMTDQIARILDADRNNKVVFWVGSIHGRSGIDDHEGAIERASGRLRQRYSTASVLDQQSNILSGMLSELAGGLDRPVAIRTADTPTIRESYVYNGRIVNTRNPNEDLNQRYNQWDIVIMYPVTNRQRRP